MNSNNFDVIIIGGSYAGLSAAMSLGRSLRRTLIIDSGLPCNRQTPHSHNFITHDGETPRQIALAARTQVERYHTIQFYEGLAVQASQTAIGFTIQTQSGDQFHSRKLIFATGLKDIMPDIPGYAECWGISILHCPYCHGYEVKNEKTGLIGNGEMGFEFTKMIAHWTKDLTLFTNGKSALSEEQTHQLRKHRIEIIETEINSIEHHEGKIQSIVLKDQTQVPLKAVYAKPAFVQHCDLPQALGCELTEQGLLKVDRFQQTSVPGVFACGDNITFGRAVSVSVSTGTMAGAFSNKALIDEEF